MDVTHIPEFGKMKYVHVSVDTCSGIIFASCHTGEKSRDVISHCLQAFSAWGKPKHLKTDNGPAYTSQSLLSFLKTMDITHTTGIPYNPQGQGVVERANLTLKNALYKQKGGIGADFRSPRDKLNIILFILNFLTLDKDGHSAAERHNRRSRPKDMPAVMWKDVLEGSWKGPDPVLIWSRGSVCVFPQDRNNPIWVPERLTRRVARPEPEVRDADATDAHPATDSSAGDSGTQRTMGSGEGLAYSTPGD